jgi:hypothetical protein
VTSDAGTGTPAQTGVPADTAGAAAPATSNAPVGATGAPAPGPANGQSGSSQETTKFKLASQHLGSAPADTRFAGVAILAAIFGVAGLGLFSRGFARRQGLGRRW